MTVPRERDLDEPTGGAEAVPTVTEPTTAVELSCHPLVRELARVQKDRELPDNDFARTVKFEYSGSSWGKIRAGTHAGNIPKALAAVKRALGVAASGRKAGADRGLVLLDHVDAAVAAVQIARAAEDEHRVVILVGPSGAGKSATLAYLAARFNGRRLAARPSWGRSYLPALVDIGRGLEINQDFKRVAHAESAILGYLREHPCLIVLDEANYHTGDLINFWKTVINETGCGFVMGTLPDDFRRMNREHNEEARQLIRRSVAIINIAPVSSDQVTAMVEAIYPHLHVNGHTNALAQMANRHHRIDTLMRVLDETDPAEPADLPLAIARVERAIKVENIR